MILKKTDFNKESFDFVYSLFGNKKEISKESNFPVFKQGEVKVSDASYSGDDFLLFATNDDREPFDEEKA